MTGLLSQSSAQTHTAAAAATTISPGIAGNIVQFPCMDVTCRHPRARKFHIMRDMTTSLGQKIRYYMKSESISLPVSQQSSRDWGQGSGNAKIAEL